MKTFETAIELFLVGGGLFTFIFPWRFYTKARLILLHLPLVIVSVWVSKGDTPTPFFYLVVLVYLVKLVVFAFRGQMFRRQQ